MARYMLMFVNSDEGWESQSKEEMQRSYAEIGEWWRDLQSKGVVRGGEELKPRRTATTVRRVNGAMKVTDGPFIESKENVGGFALIDVPDLDQAIAIAKSWPLGEPGRLDAAIEVRPVVER